MAKSQKLPAMQWYPGDWRKDVGVQSLSYHDRGVWFEILNLMHESERRGLLLLNGVAMPNDALARLLGLDNETLTTTLTNLLTSGVASRDAETGALMSRRMVRDENLRIIRTEAGKGGGNPLLLNQKPTTQVKQIPTPSSSSSTSSSDNKPPTATSSAVAGPPKSSEPPDARHRCVGSHIQQRIRDACPELEGSEWSARDGRALKRFLQQHPRLTAEQINRMVDSRMDSEDVAPAPAHAWIPELLRYSSGSLNRFGRISRPTRQTIDAALGTRRHHEEPQELVPSIELPSELDRDAGAAEWKVIKEKLGETVNKHAHDTWIKPTHGEGIHGEMLYVRIPTPEFAIIGERFSQEIGRALPDHIATVMYFHLVPAALMSGVPGTYSKKLPQAADHSAIELQFTVPKITDLEHG